MGQVYERARIVTVPTFVITGGTIDCEEDSLRCLQRLELVVKTTLGFPVFHVKPASSPYAAKVVY